MLLIVVKLKLTIHVCRIIGKQLGQCSHEKALDDRRKRSCQIIISTNRRVDERMSRKIDGDGNLLRNRVIEIITDILCRRVVDKTRSVINVSRKLKRHRRLLAILNTRLTITSFF